MKGRVPHGAASAKGDPYLEHLALAEAAHIHVSCRRDRSPRAIRLRRQADVLDMAAFAVPATSLIGCYRKAAALLDYCSRTKDENPEQAYICDVLVGMLDDLAYAAGLLPRPRRPRR